MSVAQKKAVVRTSGGGVFWGYLPPSDLLRGDTVDLMQTDGKIKALAFNEIETISYVRDFNLDDPVEPERLGRRIFLGRPREEGLWLRVALREGAPLEGLMSVEAGFLDDLIADRGVYLKPPDARGNTFRIFLPAHAIRSTEVLGLIASPAKKEAAKAAERRALAVQAGLFEEPS